MKYKIDTGVINSKSAKNILEKLRYFMRSLMKVRQAKICPFCGGKNFDIVDTKYIVTTLLKCKSCHLNFRHPQDDLKFINKFYQNKYSIDSHITNMPSANELKELMANNFPLSRDYSGYIRSLSHASLNRVIDYGCSWGYTLYQLKKAGFDVQGFEISGMRAEYGKKLGVDIKSKENEIRADNDVLLSSHVIEHLHSIKDFISKASSILKPDGFFIAFCPNGSQEYKDREPGVFHVNWGFLHPNYLDIDFAMFAFRNNPYLVLTSDWFYDTKQIAGWDGKSQVTGHKRDGKELLIIAKPNVRIK